MIKLPSIGKTQTKEHNMNMLDDLVFNVGAFAYLVPFSSLQWLSGLHQCCGRSQLLGLLYLQGELVFCLLHFLFGVVEGVFLNSGDS